MGQCLLELPDSLLEQATRIAMQTNLPLDQVLIEAITKGLHESLLEQWAESADINACCAVLTKM